MNGEGGKEGRSKFFGRRSRACEACNRCKLRCELSYKSQNPPCDRCIRLGKECNYTPATRSTKADTRVTELEGQVAKLTALIQAHGLNGDIPTGQAYPQSTQDQVDERTGVAASTSQSSSSAEFGVKRKRTTPAVSNKLVESKSVDDPSDALGSQAEDETEQERLLRMLEQQQGHCVLDRTDISTTIAQLVDNALQKRIFDQYISNFALHFPFVVFHPSTTASYIRSSKPLLFLAILSSASSGIVSSSLQAVITQKLITAFAKSVFVNGEKSLEMVQSLLVACLWFRAPKHHWQANLAQLVQTAVLMARDIGLDGAQVPVMNENGRRAGDLERMAASVEGRRTWAGCYILSASMALITRQTTTVEWTPYLQSCVDVLTDHEDAARSDGLLCKFVKGERLCEDVGRNLGLIDPKSTASISDPSTQYLMDILGDDLKRWLSVSMEKFSNSPLSFWGPLIALYVNEPAVHLNHNIQAFKAPFTRNSLSGFDLSSGGHLLPRHITALHNCRSSAQGVLDAFLSYPLEIALILPPILYATRAIYALIILIKLDFSTGTPDSHLSKALSVEQLRVGEYLDRMTKMSGRLAELDENNSQSRILLIVPKLKEWYTAEKMAGTHVDKPLISFNLGSFVQGMQQAMPMGASRFSLQDCERDQTTQNIAVDFFPQAHEGVFGSNLDMWNPVDNPFSEPSFGLDLDGGLLTYVERDNVTQSQALVSSSRPARPW